MIKMIMNNNKSMKKIHLILLKNKEQVKFFKKFINVKIAMNLEDGKASKGKKIKNNIIASTPIVKEVVNFIHMCMNEKFIFVIIPCKIIVF